MVVLCIDQMHDVIIVQFAQNLLVISSENDCALVYPINVRSNIQIACNKILQRKTMYK